jgi:hypothetical protein
MSDMTSVTRQRGTVFKTLAGERLWKVRAACAATLHERVHAYRIASAMRPDPRVKTPPANRAPCLPASTSLFTPVAAPSGQKRFP